ncbi:MAG: OsmC family protein [Phenylobacterium sp.]|uniref:OsmC family protein n=1 Tax=Phenylobacterium sp. TaxID=1871053 RepID=UPI00391B0ED2
MHQRTVTVAENGLGPFGQDVRARHLHIRADEPEDVGGLGEGFDPYELLLAGLAACTSMTIRLYARHKGWPLEHVEVVAHHAERLAEGAAQDVFTREIRLDGDLSEEERQRLFAIAEKCPVSRTLAKGVEIRSTLSEAGEGVGEGTS